MIGHASRFIFAIALAMGGLAVSAPANATKDKVNVIGVPADTPQIEGTKCVIAGLCFSKKRGAYTYDSGVWGMAKFREGEVTLRDGTVMSGQVAMLGKSNDWNFVRRMVLVIPTGESEAVFVGSDDAALITVQTKKQGTRVFDRYDGAYLQRLVSGKMRLSYNPAAGTTRPISDFIAPSLLRNISGAAGREAVIAALKDGKTVGQSLEAGRSLGSTVSDAIGSIEITQKEYLLYDENAETLTTITKDNYRGTMTQMFASCAAADAKTLKGFNKYKRITEAVEFFNANC